MKLPVSFISILAAWVSLSAQASVILVGDWTVNDNQFTDDANGTFTTAGFWFGEGGAGDIGGRMWGTGTGNGGGLYSNDPVAYAEWKFFNLANGPYQVAVSYQPDANRTPVAPFTIQGTTYFVNQEILASSFTLNDGVNDVPFETITMGAVVTDGTLTVRLDTVGSGESDYVIADAIAITGVVPEPSTVILFGFGTGILIWIRRALRLSASGR